MSPELFISPEDWARTPAAVQELVLSLWRQTQHLQGKVLEVEERLGQHSQNSSRPPSTDVGKPARRQDQSSGRKAGGQPGHRGAGRSLKPVEEVARVIAVKPEHCSCCGAELSGSDPTPARHQVTELPPVQATVTEYQLHTLQCAACGASTPAELPDGVPQGAFGPRLQAVVGLLSGAYRISQRKLRELLLDCFGGEVGLGSVGPLEQTTSEAVAEPVQEAKAYVKEQQAANLDETGWRQGNRKAWLWTATTAWVSVFAIRFTRGSGVVRELLGDTFSGVVGSDRWSAYSFLPVHSRQLCWAHLKRDFQAFVERGGKSAQLGTDLLTHLRQMFTWGYRVRDGTLKRSSFQTYMQSVKLRTRTLLRQGQECAHPKTAATCRKLLKVEPALWTFVRREGVAPTNNAAERALRHGVIWRKTSFGTQSDAGSLFVERMMTVVTTLRQQHRNVLEYLTTACEAALRGKTPPSLLPEKHGPTPLPQTT